MTAKTLAHVAEKWLGPLSIVAALLVQFGALAAFGARMDQRLAGVEAQLHELRPEVSAAAEDAMAAVISLDEVRQRLTALQLRVDLHDQALAAVGRVEERIAGQQRQLDRMEALITGGAR